MVNISSEFSLQQLSQLLAQSLGQTLSEQELSIYSTQIEILDPPTGKRFWQTAETTPGIYIILSGKARLLDSTDNAIITLGVGESFGELTLFPEKRFQTYAVRSGINLKLCFLGNELLQALTKKYPNIRKHLHHQAKLKDARLFTSDTPSKSDTNDVQQRDQDNTHTKLGETYFPKPTVKVGHLWQRFTRRYPFFQQQSSSDCGAACLVMVARYWGKSFGVNRLRELANIDRNGASLRGLAVAAETIGFATRPVKISLKKLAEQDLPAIVHWEGKHYIVVYEIVRDRVIVADPAIGQLSLKPEEFMKGWTGIALLLQPTPLLREINEDRQPFWQFFELAKPHRVVLLEVFAASVMIQIFGLIMPLFTQLLLDRVVVQRSTLTLTAVGIGLLIFGLFRVAMTGMRQYLLDHTANKIDLAMVIGFIGHTFRLPLSFFESRYVGDIISRVQENRKIQRFLTGEALSIILLSIRAIVASKNTHYLLSLT